jgi:hypothetical protein
MGKLTSLLLVVLLFFSLVIFARFLFGRRVLFLFDGVLSSSARRLS